MKIKDVLLENKILERKELVTKFLSFCKGELGLDSIPKISLLLDKEYSVEHHSFGGYNPEDKSIRLAISDRHPVDILRTLAHELVHYRQDMSGELTPTSGETGSDHENEANSMAGIIMRNFGKDNPEIYE
jgi:hypothetical protein